MKENEEENHELKWGKPKINAQKKGAKNIR
jgi:hypothetical protein